MTWLPVARIGDVARGGVIPIDLAGTPAILYRDGEDYYAAQRKCPHAGFDLAEGFVSRGALVCPLHLWRFDVRTGVFVEYPETCLTTYAVRIVGDTIEVDPRPHHAVRPGGTRE